MTIKENLANQDVWLRGLFIILFAVILYFTFVLISLLIVFQFVGKLLTGELNRQLAGFSVGLLHYISQALGYMTFQSDDKPFPFSPWPAASETGAALKPKTRGRPRGRSPKADKPS